MSTITILTTTAVIEFAGSRWARDDSGDVHVYPADDDGDGDSTATIDNEEFVAAVAGQLEPSIDQDGRDHYHHQ